MAKEQTDDTTETAYKRGYRQGMQDALKTTKLKTIEMTPRIEVWDWAGSAGRRRTIGCCATV